MRSVIVLVAIMCMIVSGCVVIRDAPQQTKELRFDDASGFYLQGPEVKTQQLKALVKGSIYSTGEHVSVFGTCLDGDDMPVNGTYAELSAWYPNGTQFIFYDNMTEISEGYYVWEGSMYAVGGTYLTELRCKLLSDPSIQALAWGEWQNPAWVEEIGNISTDVQNISITLGNIQFDIENGFNMTLEKLDQLNTTVTTQYNNLTNQIYYVGQIANGSVDRNDSLLYYLLVNLTNLVTPVNLTGTLVNWTEDVDAPIYHDTWNIRVDVYDPDDTEQRLTYPDVLCYISTTQTPTAVRMDDQGNHFVYDEFIYLRGTWTWSVSCYWA